MPAVHNTGNLNKWYLTVGQSFCAMFWMHLCGLTVPTDLDHMVVSQSGFEALLLSFRRLWRLHQEHPHCLLPALRSSFLPPNFEAKRAGRSRDQTLARAASCWWKRGKKRGQKGLLSTEAVVFDLERSAEPLARCVFYCLIIIAALLLARIYWSRQAACLLNAYEAETSCSSAVTSLWSSGWFLFPRVELSIPGVCQGDRPVRRSPVCEKSTGSGKEKKHFLMKFQKLDKILIKIFNQIWSQSLNKKKTKRRKEKGFCCVSSPSLLGVLFPDIGFSHLRKKGEFVLPSLRIINRRRSLFLYLAIYLFKGKQTFLLWTSSRLVVLVVSLLSFSSSDISQSESEYLIHPRGDLT